MKKMILSILMVSMVFLLCACGKDLEQTNNENENKNETEVKEETKKDEDLTMTRMIGSFDDILMDFPSWQEDGSETCTVVERYNYYIIAIISGEDYSFDELFNNEAKSNLRHFVDRGDYEDFIPDKSEEVTFNNGIKATKFEGTLRLEDYGDKYEYPAYGYYFKFNNYPIILMSVETSTDSILNSEEERLKTNNYVDKMVETIRNSK